MAIVFLAEMKVVLSGHSSRSFYINASASQGSVFGPILFLIFINDFPDVISSQLSVYYDDTTIYSCKSNWQLI